MDPNFTDNNNLKPGQTSSGITKVTKLGENNYIVERTELYRSGSDLDGSGWLSELFTWSGLIGAVIQLAVTYLIIRGMIWLIML